MCLHQLAFDQLHLGILMAVIFAVDGTHPISPLP
jgi:hypothetical protein